MTGPLEQLLRRVTPRCGHWWTQDTRHAFIWHTCTRWPGHIGDHVCGPCSARRAKAGAA